MAGAISGLVVGAAVGMGIFGVGFGAAVGDGAIGGGVSGVVAEGLVQLMTYGQIIDSASLAIAGISGAISGAVFAGVTYGAAKGIEAVALRRLAAQDGLPVHGQLRSGDC